MKKLLCLYMLISISMFGQSIKDDLTNYGISVIKVGQSITYKNDTTNDVYIITKEKNTKLMFTIETLKIDVNTLTEKLATAEAKITFLDNNYTTQINLWKDKFDSEVKTRIYFENKYNEIYKWDTVKNNVMSVSFTIGIVGIGASIITGVLMYYLK